MKRIGLIAAAVLLSTTAFAGAGLDPETRAFNKELSTTVGDYKNVREVIYQETQMVSNQEYNYSFRAKAGYVYQAYGDCDDNCSDLDLFVLDGKGLVLDSDVEYDSVPLFDWKAPANGTYTFRLKMIDCSADNCDVSLNVYEGLPASGN